MGGEAVENDAAYAEALAAQLESLSAEIGTGGWGKVAVLVTSTVPSPAWLSGQAQGQSEGQSEE